MADSGGKKRFEFNLIFVKFGSTIRQNMDFFFFFGGGGRGKGSDRLKVTLEDASVRKKIHGSDPKGRGQAC